MNNVIKSFLKKYSNFYAPAFSRDFSFDSVAVRNCKKYLMKTKVHENNMRAATEMISPHCVMASPGIS